MNYRIARISLLTGVAFLAIAIPLFLRPKRIAVPALGTVPTTSSKSDPRIDSAIWEVAKVFGRDGSGCQRADKGLGELVARNALRVELPPAVVAAVISVESSCNPRAVSYKGAVGIMMIHLKSHPEVDTERVNLFNSEENVRIGCNILSTLVKKDGLRTGVARYFGNGTDGLGLTDTTYADKVLRLAGLQTARISDSVKGKP